jgi:hypothetical protein
MYFHLETLLGSDHILTREGEEGEEEQGYIFFLGQSRRDGASPKINR